MSHDHLLPWPPSSSSSVILTRPPPQERPSQRLNHAPSPTPISPPRPPSTIVSRPRPPSHSNYPVSPLSSRVISFKFALPRLRIPSPHQDAPRNLHGYRHLSRLSLHREFINTAKSPPEASIHGQPSSNLHSEKPTQQQKA
ncbi:hypothetical protein V8G54_031880, partial [Vigna mungo]